LLAVGRAFAYAYLPPADWLGKYVVDIVGVFIGLKVCCVLLFSFIKQSCIAWCFCPLGYFHFLLLLFIDKKVIASFLRVVKAPHKRWIWLCRGLLLIRLVWFFMLLLLSLLDSISFIDDVKLPP
jgi:hypothetical protein